MRQTLPRRPVTGSLLGCILCLAFAAQAAEQRLVVLPLDVTRTGGKMTDDARASIEEMLRGEAANALRGTGWSVMTGATTIRILQDNGIDPAKCGEGSCHLDTAKTMNVPKFISGSVQFVEGFYTATIAIYDTKSGDILSSVRIESETIRGLGHDFAKKRDDFFAASGLLRRADRPKEVGAGSEGKIGGAGSDDLSLGAEEVVVPFESDPAGAVVVLDGELLCPATPCTKLIGMGLHKVSMQKEGYEAGAITLDVKKGARAGLSLVRSTASLTVDTTPTGLLISIDGKPTGRAPISADELRPGGHEVLIEDPCWQRLGQRVVLKKGESRNLQLAGKERMAGLKITAEDGQGNALEGTAILDEKELGAVPGSFKVGICRQRLEVVAKGGLVGYEFLHLREAKLTTAHLSLVRDFEGIPAGFVTGGVIGHPLPGKVVAAKVEPKSGVTFLGIPGGTFMFQGERSVKVQAFELAATPTTVEAYSRCTKAGACVEPKTGGACNWHTDRIDHPINCVDWHQAMAFCLWVGGRLPTEEEREYVGAGAGDEGRDYSWGSGLEPGDWVCWNGEGNGAGKGKRKTTCPVRLNEGGFSEWGVRDLAGNVWDWTSSDYEGGKKVIRGGSATTRDAELLRTRVRGGYDPSSSDADIGFRCAR